MTEIKNHICSDLCKLWGCVGVIEREGEYEGDNSLRNFLASEIVTKNPTSYLDGKEFESND